MFLIRILLTRPFGLRGGRLAIKVGIAGRDEGTLLNLSNLKQ